jgi:hypothetical protein
MWVEGGKQKALEESVGVGGFGYPSLVAVKPADLKFSTMRRCVHTVMCSGCSHTVTVCDVCVTCV